MKTKKIRIVISIIFSVLAFVFCGGCHDNGNGNSVVTKQELGGRVNEPDVFDKSGAGVVGTTSEAPAPGSPPEGIDNKGHGENGPQTPTPELDENGDLLALEGQKGIEIYTFETSPVPILRGEPVEFKLPTGETHWYEAVHLPEQGLNWLQAKELAKEASGYLATIHSREENDFVFSMIDEEKFWVTLPEIFNRVMCGPFIGAFQPVGSEEPLGGWKWVTGEPWTFSNWCGNDVPGDRDPRDNTQPNNSGGNRQQNTVAYGEVNERVSYWCDLHVDLAGTHGFIIEYNQKPFSIHRSSGHEIRP